MPTDKVAAGSRPAAAFDPSVVRRWVERSCAAQGLPAKITDPSALDRLAILFGPPPTRRRPKRAVA